MANKVKVINPALKAALKSAAVNLAVHASGLTTESKTYEAWLAFEAALALRVGGAQVTALSHANGVTTKFRVRGAPGNIPPITSAMGDEPCHFAIFWEDAALELHISLNHGPDNGNRHELDMSVIHHRDAEILRHGAIPLPYDGRRVLGAELKAYGAAKSLDKNIARSLIGLALDLDPAAVAPALLMTRAGKIVLSGLVIAPQYFLFTSARLRASSVQLLNTYGIMSGAGVLPGSSTAQKAIDDIVAAVKCRL